MTGVNLLIILAIFAVIYFTAKWTAALVKWLNK